MEYSLGKVAGVVDVLQEIFWKFSAYNVPKIPLHKGHFCKFSAGEYPKKIHISYFPQELRK